jgi:hypothetical protein
MSNNLSTAVITANEIAKAVDFTYANDQSIYNVSVALQAILDGGNYDYVIGGKVRTYQSGGMNFIIEPIFGHCRASGVDIVELITTPQPTSVEVASATLDRLDTVQIRSIEKPTDFQQRKFKDPKTGLLSSETVPTKKLITLEIMVKRGNDGSVTAPLADTGWIKLAELFIPAGTVNITEENIENITARVSGQENSAWTLEKDRTFNPGYLTEVIANFLQAHNEDGTLKGDIINASSIKFGTSKNDVNGNIIPMGIPIGIKENNYNSQMSLSTIISVLAAAINEMYPYVNNLFGRYTYTADNPIAASTANVDVNVGGEMVIDGITCTAGQMVFLKDQTDKKKNGYWQVQAGSWNRYSGYTSVNNGCFNNKFVLVQAGNENAGKVYYLEKDVTEAGSADLNFKESIFSPHGLPGKVIIRDNNGRARIAAPVNENDIARKKDVDNIQLANIDKVNLDIIYPVGSGYIQHLNDPDPIEKGLPGHWSPWSGRAEAYRLSSSALPAFTIYTPNANYAADAYVLWHLPGAGYELFKAKAAITNAAAQLDPVLWEKYELGDIIERRHLQGWLDDDFEIGHVIEDGDYAGMVVCEVIARGGTFPSYEGGNRPTFIYGGVKEDAIRNIPASLYTSRNFLSETFSTTGAFKAQSLAGSLYQLDHRDINPKQSNLFFDPSLVVSVGAENSPRTRSNRWWRRVA